jgi:hypothetical protein
VTLEIVQRRLDSAITESTPKVVLLTGGWGAGKTHQWRSALRRARKGVTTHAYLSLFGVGSLAEAKKRLAEELVAALPLPDGKGTIGDVVVDASSKLRPLQMFKVLPLIPYLGKAEGLLNELSFAAVRNTVVCIDDLERKGKGLDIADIFGLASFLKEERNCRVVLIANDRKFDKEGETAASVYLEKVVDEYIEFAPTAQEACAIALGSNPDAARLLLRQYLLDLNVANIRVVSRLDKLVTELAQMLKGLDAEVIKIGVRAVAVFGVGQYLPGGEYPPIDYALEAQAIDWPAYFALDRGRNASELTEQQKKEERWRELLSRLKGPGNDAFEQALATSIRQGYLIADVRSHAESLAANLQGRALIDRFHDGWSQFWHSLDGTGAELLDSLLALSRASVGVIGPGDLKNPYEVFVEAGRQGDADLLIDEFIKARKGTPQIFDRNRSSFPEHFTGAFGSRLRAAFEEHRVVPSPEEALGRIDVDEGYSAADVEIVSRIDSAEIGRLIRAVSGRAFRARVRTLLRLASLLPDNPEAGRVSRETAALLQSWADADPVTAIRLRQYLPRPQAAPVPPEQR